MSKDATQKLAQATICLLCTIAIWKYGSQLEGTEFSGGRLTGFLLDLKDIASILFVLSLLVSFFFLRVSAVGAVLASIFALPLYIYFAAPGPFRRAFGGVYSVPLRANFVWDRWTILGICILMIAVGVSLRSFLILGKAGSQRS